MDIILFESTYGGDYSFSGDRIALSLFSIGCKYFRTPEQFFLSTPSEF